MYHTWINQTKRLELLKAPCSGSKRNPKSKTRLSKISRIDLPFMQKSKRQSKRKLKTTQMEFCKSLEKKWERSLWTFTTMKELSMTLKECLNVLSHLKKDSRNMKRNYLPKFLLQIWKIFLRNKGKSLTLNQVSKTSSQSLRLMEILIQRWSISWLIGRTYLMMNLDLPRRNFLKLSPILSLSQIL